MRAIAVALAILSACSMHEVSGLIVSAAPKKEAKVQMVETQEAQPLKDVKDPVILAAAQQMYARADELIMESSKAEASEAAEKALQGKNDEIIQRIETALQGKADEIMSKQDEEEDEQQEELDDEESDADDENMSDALKKLQAKNDELQDVANKKGASKETIEAAEKSDEELALKKQEAKNDELQELARKKGASKETIEAAEKSDGEFTLFVTKQHQKSIKKSDLLTSMFTKEDRQTFGFRKWSDSLKKQRDENDKLHAIARKKGTKEAIEAAQKSDRELDKAIAPFA